MTEDDLLDNLYDDLQDMIEKSMEDKEFIESAKIRRSLILYIAVFPYSYIASSNIPGEAKKKIFREIIDYTETAINSESFKEYLEKKSDI
jgi:hypothetical protein